MRWKNRGHEFDNVYKHIEKKKKYYLFGAGDYGIQAYDLLKDEIEIIGFIDNDPAKHTINICGKRCYSISDVNLHDDEGIILSMSQFARIDVKVQLNRLGYKENVHYFVIEVFLAVYNVYKYDKVFFSSISFMPGLACNLNCKNCFAFKPYAKKIYVNSFEKCKKDLDLFFACVDKVMLFSVSGGEPFLHPEISRIINYIDKTYGSRICTLESFTNGTIVPSDEVLQEISKCKIRYVIDDYTDALPRELDKINQLREKFDKYNINYSVYKADSWLELADRSVDYSSLSDEEMIVRRDNCSQSWQDLRDGKIYSCNYAAHASAAGVSGNGLEEYYDLTYFDKTKKKELVEFRLGYTERGYTEFCRHCKGFTTSNTEKQIPAEQI